MGHLTSRDAYKNLEQRINLFTQGAPFRYAASNGRIH